MGTPAHAPPQLVQLAQPQLVCLVDDDGVHIIYWLTLMVACLIGVLTIFVI